MTFEFKTPNGYNITVTENDMVKNYYNEDTKRLWDIYDIADYYDKDSMTYQEIATAIDDMENWF